jgi:hypothetical protein
MWPTNATGRGNATAGKGNASRHMAESTPLSDEKQWLDWRMLDLRKEIEELRAPKVELEAALRGMAEAPTAAREH